MLNTVYAHNDAFVHRDIAGEAILVPVYGEVADIEAVYTLDEVGAQIWMLIDGKRTLEQVKSAVLEGYQVAPDRAEEDLLGFVASLESIGALQSV